jgi:hypothetical protein
VTQLCEHCKVSSNSLKAGKFLSDWSPSAFRGTQRFCPAVLQAMFGHSTVGGLSKSASFSGNRVWKYLEPSSKCGQTTIFKMRNKFVALIIYSSDLEN